MCFGIHECCKMIGQDSCYISAAKITPKQCQTTFVLKVLNTSMFIALVKEWSHIHSLFPVPWTLIFHMVSCIYRHHLFEHFRHSVLFCCAFFSLSFLMQSIFMNSVTLTYIKHLFLNLLTWLWRMCFKGWIKRACFHSCVCYGSGWVCVNGFNSSSLCALGKRLFGNVMGSHTFSGVVSFNSVPQRRCKVDVKHTSFLSNLHWCLVAYHSWL